jgi:hypothetical protein
MRENPTSGTVRIESKDPTHGFGFNGIDDPSLLGTMAALLDLFRGEAVGPSWRITTYLATNGMFT